MIKKWNKIFLICVLIFLAIMLSAVRRKDNSILEKYLSGRIVVPPLVYDQKIILDQILFPPSKPFEEGYLKVSEIHQIWYAQYGNRSGVPIVVLHGGPGAGSGELDMRHFDPKFYRIIVFDQRGAKRSRPLGEIQENTTQDLIQDLEQLRVYLKIKKWLISGGSWGSTLGLAYGEAHSEKCLGFVLRGIFLGTKVEYNQFWLGIKDTYPEAWNDLSLSVPADERPNLADAFHHRLLHPDPNVYLPAARAFTKYENAISFALTSRKESSENSDDIASMGRVFAHYGKNHFFLKENQIINNISKIEHLPVFIVHGRFDAVCKVQSAFLLHQKWPGSRLLIIQDAGHSSTEPGIAKALVESTEQFKHLIFPQSP